MTFVNLFFLILPNWLKTQLPSNTKRTNLLYFKYKYLAIFGFFSFQTVEKWPAKSQ